VPAFDVLHSESIKVSKHEATVELNTENPPVIKLDRYFESPAAACVALGILQATLTKMIHDGNVRSVEIGRTRLIEKPADAWQRRMARDAQ
jgi:excisionase family DNA binding protein